MFTWIQCNTVPDYIVHLHSDMSPGWLLGLNMSAIILWSSLFYLRFIYDICIISTDGNESLLALQGKLPPRTDHQIYHLLFWPIWQRCQVTESNQIFRRLNYQSNKINRLISIFTSIPRKEWLKEQTTATK